MNADAADFKELICVFLRSSASKKVSGLSSIKSNESGSEVRRLTCSVGAVALPNMQEHTLTGTGAPALRIAKGKPYGMGAQNDADGSSPQ